MRVKYKGNPKKVLLILIFFAFIFLIGYQANLNPITPFSNDQFTNGPNEAELLASEKYYTWLDNGSVICNVGQTQQNPNLISDGLGGAIIIWTDARTGTSNIYAQRVDNSGNRLWAPNGVRLCLAPGAQTSPIICSDGQGGAIIAWQDYRSPSADIWAQRINSTGQLKWTSNGIPICTYPFEQYIAGIESDGSGGAILPWTDLRRGNRDIFAQRVNTNGIPQWTLNGTPICTAIGIQEAASLCSDGVGGAIIGWADQRAGNWDIYARRILTNGTTAWTVNGTKVCTLSLDQTGPQICSDGVGGAVIVWTHGPGGSQDIYAQRINAAGGTQWTVNGTAICNVTASQLYPVITSDTLGGVIIAWNDYRNSNYDIYAQRINLSGNIYWLTNGAPVCTLPGEQYMVRICRDGHKGAFVTWRDYRNSQYDIYAQLVNFLGQGQYQVGGTAVCNATDTQSNPAIINDGTDGAIIVWDDYRNFVTTGYDIYAQKMKYIDTTGPLVPTISSTSHPNQNTWYVSMSVAVSWTVPQDVSGISNYLYRYDQTPTTVPNPTDARTTGLSTSFSIPSEGVWYFHVRANDTLGNLGDTGHYKLNIDTMPPVASNPRPANLAFTNKSKPNIALDLTDPLSGINASSIQMWVNGTPVASTWNGLTVNWTPSTPYASGTLVNVRVDGQDTVGNIMTPYTWSFRIDLVSPVASNSRPANLAYTNKSKPNIALDLTDPLSGINASSIQMRVNGTPVVSAWNGVTVNWTPSTPYASGTLVNVQVNAKDNAGNILGFSWSFRTDSNPPISGIIVYPTYGANVTGMLSIQVTATDNIGGTGVAFVELYDGVPPLKMIGNSTIFFVWNTVAETPGLHTLYLRVYDYVRNMYQNATGFPIYIDNTPPTTACIISPIYNANLTGSVSITATALDNAGGTGINFVEFYDNASFLGFDWWAPYSYTWTPAEGLHRLTIRAYDFAGLMLNNATSVPIHIDNTNPILARVTIPVYNSNVTGGLTVTTIAADNGGGTGIRYVELWDGAVLRGTDYWAPYQYSWVPTEGLHTLTVRAYDFAGRVLNNGTGYPINIDNTNPITACITSPVYNANITGVVTITAIATDNAGGTGIRYVEFYDGALLGTDYWAPYQYAWSPTEGLHTLTVRAYDFAGRVLNNATGVPIHIDNAAPITAYIIAPVYNANLSGVVTITATATDNGGGTGIWYVEFYDGALINRDYWAPYQYNWSPTEGLHTLTVGAFDFAGQNLENGTGVLIHIDNTNPILVCITSPVYNANVTSIISAKAIAADNINGTGIRYVEFWDGAILRSTDYWAPYQYSWIATEGLHTLTVRAYDFAGHGLTNGTGVPVHVDKNNPIMVRITAPTFNSNLTGQVTVTAIAADDAGGTGIRYVSFYDKALLLGNDYWMPYEYTWTPTVGLHNLTVYAFDFAGYMLVNATGIPFHIDNSNPITACISSPIYDANLSGEVTIKVTAADNGGGTGIRYVEFYDGVLLGSDYWAPYEYSWIPAEGLHTLTVRAYDFAGHMLNNATGVPLNIDNTNPITACITSPTYNANISGGMTITAIAADNVGGSGIQYVAFYDGAGLLGTDYWAPYQYFWSPTEGLHNLTVRAYDFAGLMLTNVTAVPIRIDNTDPITVCITSPINNANLTGTVTVTVNAADNVGGSGIWFVEFLVDGFIEGFGTSAPYEFLWVPAFWEGTYTLTVRAMDFAGRWRFNATEIQVRIDNTDPITACITSPVYNANLTGAITIRANAADAGGSGIQYVAFYDGVGLLGTDYWAPYQYFWSPTEGLHNLTVRAYDFAGRVLNNATGVPIHIDNTPPLLSIIFPVIDGLNLFGSTIWLNGTASDPNTMVIAVKCNDSRFDLYKIPTIGSPTFAYRNNSVVLGLVRVRINATDVLGYVQSRSRWFNSISVPTPNVIITVPTNGAMINPSRIWINGTTEAGADQNIIVMLINHPSFTNATNLIGKLSGAFGYYNTSNIADGIIMINITTVNGLGRMSSALVTFTLDTVAPVASNPTPQNLTYIKNPTPNIVVTLTDLLSGINASSILMQINGTPVIHSWNGLTVNWTASPVFLDGRVVLVVVNAKDFAQNVMVTCRWLFTVDITCPEGSDPVPRNNTFVNDPIPNIAMILRDRGSGINVSSLIMRINGNPVSYTWDGLTISWMPLINFVDNSFINVTVDAYDNLGHIMPTYRWGFRIDLALPVASGETPANGTYINDPTPEICLTITDSFAGVNGSSILMRINGTPVSPVWNGWSANYTAGPYASETKLIISVDACDNAGNALLTKVWTFFIDTQPPSCDILFAEGNPTYTGGSMQSIRWRSLDFSTISIKLEYSLDNSDSWQEINEGAYSHLHDGIEAWIIPSVYAEQCRVRITATDAAGQSNVTISGFFSIIKPASLDYWVYIIIGVGAVAGVAITVLYMRSRKPTVSGGIQKPKWIAGVEATFPAEMALTDKIEMIIAKGIPLEDIADPGIKKLLETPMGGLSLEILEKLRQVSIPPEELRQIIAELSTLTPEEQIKYIDELSKSMAN